MRLGPHGGDAVRSPAGAHRPAREPEEVRRHRAQAADAGGAAGGQAARLLAGVGGMYTHKQRKGFSDNSTLTTVKQFQRQ